MFDIYVCALNSHIQKMSFNNQDDINLLTQAVDDIFALSQHDENLFIFFGESTALLELFITLFELPPEVTGVSPKSFLLYNFDPNIKRGKVDHKQKYMFHSLCGKLLYAISEALSYHCNPVLLKKYLAVMPQLAHKLPNHERKKEIIQLLDYFMQFFQRILIADSSYVNNLPYPIDVIRVNHNLSNSQWRTKPITGKVNFMTLK